MNRPTLREIPIPANPFMPGTVTFTMSPGQWDALLAAAYSRGALLLEIEDSDEGEHVARAYRKEK